VLLCATVCCNLFAAVCCNVCFAVCCNLLQCVGEGVEEKGVFERELVGGSYCSILGACARVTMKARARVSVCV